jgi:hypothetical protein
MLKFECPVCHKSRPLEIKTQYGKPKFKLQIDMGNGQVPVVDMSFTLCQECKNIQFFLPSEKFGLLTE